MLLNECAYRSATLDRLGAGSGGGGSYGGAHCILESGPQIKYIVNRERLHLMKCVKYCLCSLDGISILPPLLHL